MSPDQASADSASALDATLPEVTVTYEGGTGAAARFLKALSHDGRLLILCHLANGERSVSDLVSVMDSRQAAVSQQLARLRLDGMVSCRRDGKVMYYAISDPRVSRIIDVMGDMFCH